MKRVKQRAFKIRMASGRDGRVWKVAESRDVAREREIVAAEERRRAFRQADANERWSARASRERVDEKFGVVELLQFWNIGVTRRSLDTWRLIPRESRVSSKIKALGHLGTGRVVATDGVVCLWENRWRGLIVNKANVEPVKDKSLWREPKATTASKTKSTNFEQRKQQAVEDLLKLLDL